MAPDNVLAISLVSCTLKLSSSLSDNLRRSRISSESWLITCSEDAPSCIEMRMVLTSCLPVSRRCTVRSGITMVSSWSRPIAL